MLVHIYCTSTEVTLHPFCWFNIFILLEILMWFPLQQLGIEESLLLTELLL
jgi:hypothetical protein